MNAQRIEDLVTAYKILLNEDVLDSFGHVSVRSANDPTRFLMPYAMPPSLVRAEDVIEYTVADSQPVDASLTLRHYVPVAHPSKPGRRLMQTVAARQVSLAIRKHERSLELPFQELDPKITDADLGKAIVIKRGSNQLLYYNGDKLKRTFRVATGQSSYPTPLGNYEIVTMQRNPWWYPPQGSAWAEGATAIPPGPGNPLGTRWMGISSPYVGIHGTPDAASIGYSASHGCIRMLIPQVEWLFQRVDVGTPVFIVPA